jgi:hypothetical protein
MDRMVIIMELLVQVGQADDYSILEQLLYDGQLMIRMEQLAHVERLVIIME